MVRQIMIPSLLVLALGLALQQAASANGSRGQDPTGVDKPCDGCTVAGTGRWGEDISRFILEAGRSGGNSGNNRGRRW